MRASRSLTTIIGGLVATSVLATAAPAFAHVSINTYGTTFTAGATNAFAFRVPHGCPDDLTTFAANARTSRVEVTVPAAATGVKPEQKPGWDVSVVRDGTTKAVTQITWTVRDQRDSLADWTFADFGVRATLNGVAGDVLVFPTTQYCDYHDDFSAATLTEVWSGANAPKLTLVGAGQKVSSAADLAAVAGRLGTAETDIDAAQATIVSHAASIATLGGKVTTLEAKVAALQTAMTKAAQKIADLVASLADLRATVRLGHVSVMQQPTGTTAILVDLPSTRRFQTIDVKVGGTSVLTVQLNSAGDAAATLPVSQSAGLAKGAKVEVLVGSKVVAQGKVG
ncbi:MAG: DUF1775 domain-containing protein [Ilumatobacteraceae bacterium]